MVIRFSVIGNFDPSQAEVTSQQEIDMPVMSLADVVARSGDLTMKFPYTVSIYVQIEIFRGIWEVMTRGPNAKEIQDHINAVEKHFNI